MKPRFTAAALATGSAVLLVISSTIVPARGDWATDALYRTNGVPYMLYVPPSYDATNLYPLVLFLHGAGGEGSNNENHVWNGSEGKNSWVAMGTTFVLAPQGPVNSGWANSNNIHLAWNVLQAEMTNWSINPRRLYCTGLSRGGRATFNMVAYHPRAFAAATPLCGWSDYWWNSDPGLAQTSEWAHLLIHTPLWIHHGLADDVVPPINSRWLYAKMGQAITNAGGTVDTNLHRLTEWPGVNHGVWTPVYNDPAHNLWLFDFWLDEWYAPGAPADLSFSSISDNSLTLQWASTNDSLTIEAYDVYRDGNYHASVTNTWYEDVLLEPGSNYGYQVCARNHREMSSPTSAVAAAVTLADFQPPNLLRAEVLNWDRVRVQFTERVEGELTPNPGNFRLEPEGTVLGASRTEDGKAVVLRTTHLAYHLTYTVRVHNAEDLLNQRRHNLAVSFHHSTPWVAMPSADSFEGLSAGAALQPVNGWLAAPTGAAVVVQDADILTRLTNDYAAGFPILTSHTRVVTVDDGVATRLLAAPPCATSTVEFLLEPAPWPSPTPPRADAQAQAALYLKSNGHLALWHGYFSGSVFTTQWTELSHPALTAPTQWVRVAMTYDFTHTRPFLRLDLDGTPLISPFGYSDKSGLAGPGPWFLTAQTNRHHLESFSASGCHLDDLVIGADAEAPGGWTIGILALTNGLVISSNNAGLVTGADADFSIEAAMYHHLDEVTTNGSTLGIDFGQSSSFLLTWSNVATHGFVGAHFAPDLTTNTHTPVWWLARHYGQTNYEAAALSDTDGDGYAAWQEEWCGSDPTQGASFFRHEPPAREAGNVVLRWASCSNRTYIVDSATNLEEGSWLSWATHIPGTPPENSCTVETENVEAETFRVGVSKHE